jgi:hypothetical protein
MLTLALALTAVASAPAGRAGCVVTAPDLRHDVHVEIRFDGVTWTDVTPDLLQQAVSITYGRQDEMSAVQPTEMSFVLLNPVGAYTPELPTSPHSPNVRLGVQARARIGPEVHVVGEVTSWAPSWPHGDLSGDDLDEAPGDARVDVTVSGIMRRLGQGTEPLRDAFYRFAITHHPDDLIGYWPGSDTDGAGLSSAVNGPRLRPRLIEGDVGWGQGRLHPWLPPGVLTGEGSSGILAAPVNGVAGPANWSVDWLYGATVPAPDSTDLPMAMSVTVDGANGYRFRAEITPDPGGGSDDFVVAVRFIDDEGGLLGSATVPIGDLLDGGTHHMRFRVVESGVTDSTWQVWADGVMLGAGVIDIGVPDMPAAAALELEWATFLGFRLPVAFGQVAMWSPSPSSAEVPDAAAASLGHAFEPAGRRIERLCAEEGVPFSFLGDLDDTAPLGAQRPAALHDLLQNAAVADLGILHEQQAAEPGLAYRTRRSIYNQTPAIVLDASAGPGEITHPFAPILDDQGAVNDITVERQGGSSVRRVDEADVQRRGRYESQVTIDVASDLQLPDQAGWRLHLGTWPGMRYPAVSPALNAAPGLIPAWEALRLGDKLRVVGLPPQHPAAAVDLIVQGWTETIRPWRWDVEVNCRPAGPWTVAVYSDSGVTPAPDAPMRYSPQSTVTDLEFAAGIDTSLIVRPEGVPFDPWTTDPAAVPFDVAVFGVRLRVTAVSVLPLGRHALTVEQQPVNGVTKTIPAGTPVELWTPARYAL